MTRNCAAEVARQFACCDHRCSRQDVASQCSYFRTFIPRFKVINRILRPLFNLIHIIESRSSYRPKGKGFVEWTNPTAKKYSTTNCGSLPSGRLGQGIVTKITCLSSFSQYCSVGFTPFPGHNYRRMKKTRCPEKFLFHKYRSTLPIGAKISADCSVSGLKQSKKTSECIVGTIKLEIQQWPSSSKAPL